jgi:hypothetical protein
VPPQASGVAACLLFLFNFRGLRWLEASLVIGN